MRITRRVKHRLIAASVTAGALGLTAAGASAFTDSNTLSNTNVHVGYQYQGISGATITNVAYTLDSTGAYVDTVTLTATGDTTGSAAEVAFTNTTGESPVLSSYFSCADGVAVGSDPVTATTYACTIGTGDAGYAMADFQGLSIVVK